MSAQDEQPLDLPPDQPQRVGEIAELFLGNILFALERTAMAMDAESKPEDAAFYRGIGRTLAEAHGRSRHAR
ncbi:MAG: hypothetical protein H7099_16510 [Gemmatimonadaceae bacterium]|nr:hypothetical protein [Gemmatimonadaceae bacterium]